MINLLGKRLYFKTSSLIELIMFEQPLSILFILGFIYKPMALQKEDQYLRPQLKYIRKLMKNCNIDCTAPSKSLGEIY